MNRDWSKELFDNYARHYASMGEVERLPDDIDKLRRDRLPAWIDSIPKDARILDAGCAQGDLLLALSRVGYTHLTGVDLSARYCAAIDFTHVTHFTEFSLLQVLEAAGFAADGTTLPSQAPRLFWSWRKPHRAVLRVFNRLRWHFNNALHQAVLSLSDMHPRPRVFDPNLVVLARK